MKYSLRSLMTFSIRDMFWLILVVALALGWWLDHSQPATTSRIKAMLQRGGWVTKDGGGHTLDYMTTDGGTTVTVWEFSDDQNFYRLPTSSAPAPNPPKP